MDAASTTAGARSSLAASVFVAAIAFYAITLTPFIDLSAAGSVDPAADRSNLLNQLCFLALTAAIFALVLTARSRELLLRPRGLLLALGLWLLAGAAASAHPMLAFKHDVLAALTVADAGAILLLPRSERDFARLLAICCLVTLALSYAGVALLPRLAIHQASELREPMNAGLWRGHFPHKNAAAAAMVVLAFCGLYVRSAGFRRAGLLVAVLSTLFLAKTGGKTSTAELPAVLLLAHVFERRPALRMPMVVGGIAAFNAVTIGCAVSPGMRALVEGVGLDPTFTNRTDIWNIAVSAIAAHPLLGHGLQAFWQTDELVYSGGAGASWAVAAFNGHNAYLDTALSAGLPGLALTVAWLLAYPLVSYSRIATRGGDPALTRLFLRIWLYGVFASCVESIFFQSGDLAWFALVFSVFGLGLQAQGRCELVARLPARPALAHA